MLDFLFITSPTNARNPHPPYYFLYLAAYLRAKGLEVKIIDPKGGDRPHELVEHVSDIVVGVIRNPSRFVGLAAFHSDYNTILALGERIKFHQPETTLLVGNAHATLNPEDFIYPMSPFDIAVLGEGEVTCFELLAWWLQGLNKYELRKVKGVAYYHAVQTVPFIRTEKREVLDMSALPLPAYDLIDMDYYLRPNKLIIRRIYASMVCVFAGRGCPFDCDFCAANNVWKANEGKACRLRSAKDVIKEITDLKLRYKADFFYLFDDMFGMSKKWMRDWFFMKGNYWPDFPYATQTRADIASEEMVKGLKETGCIQLDIGVEAGSQRLLDKVNKGITLDQIRQVFSWCEKYKIRSFATMLLNLPTETQADLDATYNFIKEIRPTAGLIFGVTTPYPGTKLYAEHVDPPLQLHEYSLLINNRLNPIERFRMAEHKVDLEVLWDKWNRKFLATPMFERMWALRPWQSIYWKTVMRSTRLASYVHCWILDLPKTFVLWWMHKLGIYRFAKKIQYGDK